MFCLSLLQEIREKVLVISKHDIRYVWWTIRLPKLFSRKNVGEIDRMHVYQISAQNANLLSFDFTTKLF